MGHERIGSLPRTVKWQKILADIAQFQVDVGDVTISDIARHTLKNVRTRYEKIHKDSGVQAAFAYLLSLATDCYHRPETRRIVGLDLDENPSHLRIAAKLNWWVNAHIDSTEYAELARRAGGDVIAQWTQQEKTQYELFEKQTARSVWDAASKAGGFCEVSRIFFARFTERYLRYFLEREASAGIHSLEARETFSQQLNIHVDKISKHAYETAKINQSFAAGWFNNHAQNNHPSAKQIERFLALSFGKLQEELHREESK